jgi:hypothetical protein
MFQRKPRRFGRSSNGRGHRNHSGGMQSRQRTNSFSNIQPRNNFRPTLSAEKLLEKYTSLAKEATTSGDIILSENYLQHADHFIRVIEDKNKNRNQNKANVVDNSIKESNSSADTTNSTPQDTKIKN